jgi:molybdenum cofactor guanylyltransferase
MSPSSSPQKARGCVLAGGAGSRLGGAKATVEVDGRPLISYPLVALEGAGLEPIVVAKQDTPLPPLERAAWLEPAEPRHPLTGIVEALGHWNGPLIVCACDMPFVTAELAAWLASLPSPLVVPRFEGRLHPLLARYDAGLLKPLMEALGAERPLLDAVRELGPRYVEENELRRFGDPAKLLFNVNSPEDLDHAERILEAASS